MNIVWNYLDKKTAAINALRDYSNMEFIIEHTDESIAAIYGKVESPRSSLPTGLPKAYNPKASEDRLASWIDEIDILKERYRQALEYMKWLSQPGRCLMRPPAISCKNSSCEISLRQRLF